MFHSIRASILFAGCLVFSGLQAAPVDDVRIVIDVSGSMVKTDPNNLRVPALRLLNGLVPSGSNAGVWTFGRFVNMEVKWGKVDDQWRKLADKGAAAIHSKGQFTNIERALQRAGKGWEAADPNARRNLILLTDGKVDVSKDHALNTASRERILTQSIKHLAKVGVKVHTIALSRYTDEALLRRLAAETSGSFEHAESADDLQKIFFRIFERATQPDTVPMVDNEFKIDGSVKEMTLLVFRKGDKETRIIDPANDTYSENERPANVNWRNDLGYDLITIKGPRAGSWKLDADIDPDNRVMVVTDLKLVAKDIPPFIRPDQSLTLHIELHDKDKKIAKNSFLKFVDFKVVHRLGDEINSHPLNLKKSKRVEDKGIYLFPIEAPVVEGDHEWVIKADARTFARSKRLSTSVQWPVTARVIEQDEEAGYRIEIKVNDALVDTDSIRPGLILKYPDGKTRDLALDRSSEPWSTEVTLDEQDGEYVLSTTINASSASGEEISFSLPEQTMIGKVPVVELPEVVEEKQPEMTQPEIIEEIPAEEESNLMMTIIALVVINAVLFGGGFAGWVIWRKRKASVEVNLIEGVEVDYDSAPEKTEAAESDDSATDVKPDEEGESDSEQDKATTPDQSEIQQDSAASTAETEAADGKVNT